MDKLTIFIPLTKVDVEKRLVFGTVAEEIADKASEIMDYETAKPQFAAWSSQFEKITDGQSVGNLRAMHGSIAAGKLTTISFDDANKRIEACGKVVDDGEWNKVLEGVYTGFSMGGKYLKRWKDETDPTLTRYTPVPAEVSLVDNPCIPTATFEVVKADGSLELRKFKTIEAAPETAPTNVAPDVEQGWRAKDGSFHATKAAALKHNADVDAETLAKAAAAPAQAALEKLDAALKGSTAPAPVVAPGEDENLGKKAYSADDRKKMATKGEAKKDGSYPIKTAQDVKNAVKDFGRSKGSDSDKKHIIARAKAIGATDSLPDDWQPKKKADKAGRADDLAKSLYQVSRLALLTEELCWAKDSIDWEAAAEKDGSPAGDHLQAIIGELCDFLVAYTIEETGEEKDDTQADYEGDEYEIIELAAKAVGFKRVDLIAKALPDGAFKRALEKAGARHSKVDQKRVQDMHDTSVDLGAQCDGKAAGADDAGKHVHADDLAKAAGESAALRKALDELAPKIEMAVAKITEQGVELAAQKTEIERLNAQPMPGGPVVSGTRTVSKGDETGADESDPVKAFQKHLETLPANQRALALMKMSLAQPQGSAPAPLGKRT